MRMKNLYRTLYKLTCPYDLDDSELPSFNPPGYAAVSAVWLALAAAAGALLILMDAVLDNYSIGPYDQLLAILSGRNLLSLLAAIVMVVLVVRLKRNKIAELAICGICTTNCLVYYTVDHSGPVMLALLFTGLVIACLIAAYCRKKLIYPILAAALVPAAYYTVSQDPYFYVSACLFLTLYIFTAGLMLRADPENDPENSEETSIVPEA